MFWNAWLRGKLDQIGIGLLIAHIMGVTLLAFVGIAAYEDVLNKIRTTYYESTEGTVVGSQEFGDSSYGKEIRYSVDGKMYSLNIGEYRPTGEKIVICYNPKNPEKSFIKEEAGEGALSFFLVISPFLIVGSLVLIIKFIIKQIKKAIKKKEKELYEICDEEEF